MSNSLRMAIVKNQHHLFENNSSFFLGKIAFIYNLIKKFATSAELCDHVYVSVILKSLIEFDDIGMVKSW